MPRSTRLRFIRLFVNSPARISSIVESAIWVVARAVRKREAARAPDGWPAVLLIAETRSGRVLWSAGNSPKSRPVVIATAAVNISVVGSRRSLMKEVSSRGIRAMMPVSDQRATTRPSAPPIAASRADSVRSWRTTCQRLAPIDSRTAISLARAAPRASSRLAMLAQAISSTKPVTASSRVSAGPRRA